MRWKYLKNFSICSLSGEYIIFSIFFFSFSFLVCLFRIFSTLKSFASFCGMTDIHIEYEKAEQKKNTKLIKIAILYFFFHFQYSANNILEFLVHKENIDDEIVKSCEDKPQHFFFHFFQIMMQSSRIYCLCTQCDNM